MTRAEAKQRVAELWGEAGLLPRLGILLGVLGSMWLMVTAAYSVAGNLFVTRPAFERYVQQRDSTLARYLYVRDSTQAIKNEREEVFQLEVRRFMYRDCVRRYGAKSCFEPK